MGRIAVFDSGLGSLSLIEPLRRATRAQIIYLADSRSYPYGSMNPARLYESARISIQMLQERFCPDVIVVGSNTPSLLASKLLGRRIIGVLPPIRDALKISRTKKIAVMATKSVTTSDELLCYIAVQTAHTKCTVTGINASKLIDLVENGKFMTRRAYCAKIIHSTLANTFKKNSIDTATLSSTHLPLLLPIFNEVFPNITFVDPAERLVKRITKLAGVQSKRSTLRVYTTGNSKTLELKLARMNLYYKVHQI